MADFTSYKMLRIMNPEQEFIVVDGQNTYTIGNIDLTDIVFFTKKELEYFINVPSENYSLINVGTENCAIVFSDGFLDDKDYIQVCREFIIYSSEYITDNPNLIIMKDKLNLLISEVTDLTEIIRKIQTKTDDKDFNYIFPKLQPDETFVMLDDGSLGAIKITDVESFINDAKAQIDAFTEEQKEEINIYTEGKKTEINGVADARIVDINANADARIFEIETLAENERISIDQFTETQKDEIIATTNIGKFQLNQIIEDGKSQLLERVSTSTSYNSTANEYSVTTTNPRVHYQGEIITITFSDTNVLVNPNIRFDQDISFYPLRLLQDNQVADLPPNYIDVTKTYEVSYVGNNFLLYEAGINVATDNDLGIVKGGLHNTIGVDGSINVTVANGVTKGVVSQGTGCTIVDGVINIPVPVPIGGVLFMANSTNPTTIWTSTGWLPIEDSMIRAAKSTENALATGGSDSVTLEVANIPSHTHVFTGNSASVTRGTQEILGSLSSLSGTSFFDKTGALSESSQGGVYVPSGSSYKTVGIGFKASLGWTGSSSEITPTGTNSSTGSGTAFSVLNKYTALKVWYRVS